MSVLLEAIQKIRGRRQEQAKSVWQQYAMMIDTLARGDQCDVDALGVVMDQLDKSEKELASDVELKQKRLAAARRLEQFRALNAQIPELEQKHEAAQRDYAAAVAKAQPKVAQAWDKLKEAQTQLIQFASAENELLQSCGDPAILDAQRDIDTMRSDLSAEMRELAERVRDGEMQLQHARSLLAGCEHKAAKVRSGDEREYEKGLSAREVHKAKTALDQITERNRPLFARRDEINRDLRELAERQIELNKRKLIP